MADVHPDRPSTGHSRREFIKSTSALVAGGAISGVGARLARSAHPGGSDEIKVAVIGAGGRGIGAGLQALETEGPVTLWAVADAFADQVETCVRRSRQAIRRGRDAENPLLADAKVDVPDERRFVGFDAFQRAIDSGVDLVLLATPPGFRPQHFEAAVEAGKHVFMEKPVAVDAPGVRRVLAANEKAKKKNLMVAVGFQRHHDPRYQETIQRLQDGAIGDILYTRVYWNSGGLWVRPRQPDQTEMEYQMRNWYYFNWLCGDHIVEQHVHNIDVSNWLRGMYPVEANGMGGREVRKGREFGHIFDHHFVEFTYADGTKMFSQCRHIDGCWGQVNEFAHGTQGTSVVGSARIHGPDGEWRSRAPGVNAHHQELHNLFAALRRGEIYNEGDNGALSTMTAIMGRMATYSGKLIKWDEALESDVDLSPDEYDFAAQPPVVPDDNGAYPVPVPGKTEVMRIATS